MPVQVLFLSDNLDDVIRLCCITRLENLYELSSLHEPIISHVHLHGRMWVQGSEALAQRP